jgi:hypothetical protein
MLFIFADMEDATVHPGMKRLDAAIEHLRKAGEFRDVLDCDNGIAQQLGRTAGGNQINVQC